MNKIVRGYKVFNPDWTCRGFQYKVGETYEHKGDIKLCGSGFHFCVEALDCFKYYIFDSNNKVAEVEAIGLVETGDDKSVTNKIRIVRELDWFEVLKLVNSGKHCTGYGNSGNYNSGDCNSGHNNSGDRNSGYSNSGDENSGNCNSGYKNSGSGNSGDYNSGDNNSGNRNSGDDNSGYWNSGGYNSGYSNLGCGNSGNRNSGSFNSGNFNSGHFNSGDWNLGHYSSGVFCTEEPKIKIFDMESDMTLREWRSTKASQILADNFILNTWIYSADMTDEEKKRNPWHETAGGYLKSFSFKDACANMWNNLTDKERDIIQSIPNFNKDKFKEITGIEL